MDLSLLSTSAGALVMLLGVGVVIQEAARREAVLFLVCTLATGCWLVGFGRMYAAPDAMEAIHWAHVGYLGIPFIPAATYHFTVGILQIERRRRWVVLAAWLLALLFAGIALGTDRLVSGVELFSWGWFTTAGPVAPLLAVFFVVYWVGSLVEYVRALRRSVSATERTRIRLLSVGFLVAYLGMADFLPSYGVPIVPIGFAPVLVFLGIAGWAVWRYELVDLTPSFAAEQILRTMADPLVVVDAEMRIRIVNAAVRATLGWEEGEILGREISFLAGGDEAAGERLGALLHRTRVEEEETSLCHRDGETVPVTLSTSTLPSREGGAPGRVLLFRDVRRWKEATRRIEESEQRYRSLFLYNPDTVYGLDLEGRFTTLNPASTAVTGQPPEQLIGRPFEEILHPADSFSGREIFRRVLEGEPLEYEIRVLHREGREVRIQGVSVPVFVDGEITGVYGIARDVTEQRRAEEAVRVEREYFATLFDSSPDAIAVLDREDRVTRVNTEFERLFGYTEEEARGRSINELIVPDDRKDEGAALTRIVSEGEEIAVETVRRRRNGEPVDVSIRGRPIRVGGAPPQVYGIYRDISRRKETEQELRDKEEQLRHAQRLESVGRLAGGIAHDFNNILTVITGHAQMALDVLSPDSDEREDVEAIHRAARRAAKLTNQLLAFSRRQVIHPRPVDINRVVRETEKMLTRVLGERTRLETRLDDGVWLVHVDPAQMDQVIVNLALNARDAMPEGGHLTIETGNEWIEPEDVEEYGYEMEPGPYVVLRVRDDGEGMDEATLSQVFDPFFTTKERGKGTGLGLAMVFGSVKQSGGYILAESVPEGGSTFTIFLPRLEKEAAPPPMEPGGEGAPAETGATVMVVEDEEGVRSLVERILSGAGYTVISAVSGDEALDAVRDLEGEVDLVLTDLVMPGMGGRGLARRLRERFPDLRVVLMSGYDQDVGETDDVGLPMLEKPFGTERLLQVVAEALRRPPEGITHAG